MTNKKLIVGILSILLVVALCAGAWVLWQNRNAPPLVSSDVQARSVASIPAPTQGEIKEVLKTKEINEAVDEARMEESKLNELKEIFESKNDNDPRLDLDFKSLTEGEKLSLQQKYSATKAENLNEKGTLVFLIGRNISTESDLKFLGQVLDEEPCLSLVDCKKPAPKKIDKVEDPSQTAVSDLTLIYPQAVSIKSMESYLKDPVLKPELKAIAINNLKKAKASKSALIADLAKEALEKISP